MRYYYWNNTLSFSRSRTVGPFEFHGHKPWRIIDFRENSCCRTNKIIDQADANPLPAGSRARWKRKACRAAAAANDDRGAAAGQIIAGRGDYCFPCSLALGNRYIRAEHVRRPIVDFCALSQLNRSVMFAGRPAQSELT